MIKLLDTHGHLSPVLFCDVCERQIEDADDGMVLFAPEQLKAEVFHAHTGACCNSFHDNLANDGFREQALREHLVLLAADYGIGPRELEVDND